MSTLISQPSGAEAHALASALAEILIDCVAGGASVSFMNPLSRSASLAFWREVAGEVERGETLLLIAEEDGNPIGTVQLGIAQKPNQPHRADVKKLLVHSRARSRGVGEALMQAVEAAAQSVGKSLLVLDTASGTAEHLYARLGWTRVGTIPDYALWPDGGFCDTIVFYKMLEGHRGGN